MGAFVRPPDQGVRRVGRLTSKAADAPPGGTVLLHMQAPSADGSRVASLDPSSGLVRLLDDRGGDAGVIEAGDLENPAGLNWLEGDAGLVWWDLDHVYLSTASPAAVSRLAYQISQPDDGGPPLAIEDVRAVAGGLLVVAQACADREVRRRATFVHLRGTKVVGETDLTPWAGLMLRAANALPDGRVVLAVNDPEDVDAFQARYILDRREQPGALKTCWYLSRRSRMSAARLRVLRVHGPEVVEVQSEHPCPGFSCAVRGWAVGRDSFVLDTGSSLLSLRSALDPGPLMSSSGGIWAQWPLPRSDAGYIPPLNSSWLRGQTLLYANAEVVVLRDIGGEQLRTWRSNSRVRAVRFAADRAAVVVTMVDAIARLDVATMKTTMLLARDDVLAAADVPERFEFSDARVLPSGALLFDTALTERPEGRFIAHESVWVGQSRGGCEGPAAHPTAPHPLTSARLRQLSPRMHWEGLP